MILSSTIIPLIKVRTKNRLALAMNCSVQTIERWIKENEDNGKLTTVTAVQIIKEETGFGVDEHQIFEAGGFYLRPKV